MGRLTISMAMFNSFLYVYQRVMRTFPRGFLMGIQGELQQSGGLLHSELENHHV